MQKDDIKINKFCHRFNELLQFRTRLGKAHVCDAESSTKGKMPNDILTLLF